MALELNKDTSNKIANMGFVCTLLVVFIHVGEIPVCVGSPAWNVWYFIGMVLATISVPYFFIVSGFFLARHCDEIGWYQRSIRVR